MSLQTNPYSFSSFAAKNLVEFTIPEGNESKVKAVNGRVMTRVGAALAGIVSLVEVVVAAVIRFLVTTILQFLPRGIVKGAVIWSQDANQGAGLLWKIMLGNYSNIDNIKRDFCSFINN